MAVMAGTLGGWRGAELHVGTGVVAGALEAECWRGAWMYGPGVEVVAEGTEAGAAVKDA